MCIAVFGNNLEDNRMNFHHHESLTLITHLLIQIAVCVLPLGDMCNINPYPTAFPYGNGMVLHFYQQQESSTTKTVHKVINKGLKAYV